MQIEIPPGTKPVDAAGGFPSRGPHRGTIRSVAIVPNNAGTGENLKVAATSEREPGTLAFINCSLPNGGSNDDFFLGKLAMLARAAGLDYDPEAGASFDTDDLVGAEVTYLVKEVPSKKKEGTIFSSADPLDPESYEAQMAELEAAAEAAAAEARATGTSGKVTSLASRTSGTGTSTAGKPATRHNPFKDKK